MAEYIEREATLHRMKVEIRPPFAVVRDMPAADVAEVRHGEWENFRLGEFDLANRYKCSICGANVCTNSPFAIREYKYCLGCGAKMDGKGEPEHD